MQGPSSKNERLNKLAETASIGAALKRLVDTDDAMQHLLQRLEEDADAALRRCRDLSPYSETERAMLADTQSLARTYDLMFAKINAIMQEGKQAQAEIESERQPFTDE